MELHLTARDKNGNRVIELKDNSNIVIATVDEYEDAEYIVQAINEYPKLKEEINEVKECNKSLSDYIKRQEKQIEDLDNKIEKAIANYHEKAEENEKLKEELTETKENIVAFEESNAGLRRELGEIWKERDELKQENEKLKEKSLKKTEIYLDILEQRDELVGMLENAIPLLEYEGSQLILAKRASDLIQSIKEGVE